MCSYIDRASTQVQWTFITSYEKASELAVRIARVVDAAFELLENGLLHVKRGITCCLRGLFRALVARVYMYSLNELTGDEHRDFANHKIEKLKEKGSIVTESPFPTSLKASLSTISLVHTLVTNPERRSLIYFPGQYEIWQSAIDFLGKLHLEAGINVYAINYRGTGTSTGFPETEELMLEDAHAYIQSCNLPKESVILAGSDIGAAIATKLGSKHSYDIVSIRSFRSMTKLIQATFPIFSNFFAEFARGLHWSFDVESDLKNHTRNFVCVYSEHDTLIPFEQSVRAFIEEEKDEAFPSSKIHTIKLDEADFFEESPQLAEDPDCNPHVRPFTTKERGELVRAIMAIWNSAH